MKQILSGCGVLIGLLVVQSALGHATIWPQQSVTGTFEKYTIRIPNEKESPTVRVEAEFPSDMTVSFFEVVPGWRIEHQRDADGRIVGAVWIEGSIGPNEFAEFALMARNPDAATTLAWRIVQVHEDGSRSEWVGEHDSNNPAPITTIRAREPAPNER